MRFNRSEWSRCKECPLRDRTRVWGEGPDKGPFPIVFIGEAPGRDEDAEGHPFVGGAGRIFNYALGQAGIMRRSCWVTNVLSCRPPDNKFDSMEALEARQCCRPGFEAELDRLQKKGVRVYVPLGGSALHALGLEGSITKVRGSVYLLGEVPVVPTFHPSFIMRGQWKQEVTWINDLEKAKRLAVRKYQAPRERFNIEPTLEQLRAFVEECEQSNKLVGVDIETTSLNPEYGVIMVVGLSADGERAISVPFCSRGRSPYWDRKEWPKVQALLRRVLSLPTIFQNAMFDVPYLEANGYPVEAVAHDALLAHHAIHPELPHNLGYIVSVYGDTPYWKEEVQSRLGKVEELEDQVLRTYNLRDAVVLHQVLPGLLADLQEVGTDRVYREISLGLIRPVIDMTKNGMLLDRKRLTNWRAKLNRNHKKLEGRLREITGVPSSFTFASGDYLRLLIYGKIAPQFKKAREEMNKYEAPSSKLRKDTKKYREICEKIQVLQETVPLLIPKGYGTRKTTDSGRLSVDEEALLGVQIAANNRRTLVGKFVRPTEAHREEQAQLDRTLAFITTYREYAENEKLLSTYSSFPVGRDGRVHPQYLIHGTRTGRLSSRNPNAQNIPKEVRKIFVAPEGSQIVQADYSNLELRVLAYESKDEVLIETFKKGRNVHDQNCQDLFGLSKEDPKWDAARRAAKVYIFGRNYGGGLRGIYNRVMQQVPELGLTFAQFEAVDRSYRDKHPRYTAWVRRVLKEVTETKTLRNAFGRIRIFLGDGHEIEKEGLNFPIQSAAADIINQAVIALYRDRRYRPTGAKLIGQVHDSLVFECPSGAVSDLVRCLRRSMEQSYDFYGQTVHFPVDVEVGSDWGTLKAYKEEEWERSSSRGKGPSRPSRSSGTARKRSPSISSASPSKRSSTSAGTSRTFPTKRSSPSSGRR